MPAKIVQSYNASGWTPAGVRINTFNPQQRALYFMGPPLSARGDVLRAAQEEYEEVEEEKKLIEALEKSQNAETSDDERKFLKEKRKAANKKERQVLMKIAVESLKLQYRLDVGKNGHGEEIAITDELWIETLGEYFTDEDLLPIYLSMKSGKSLDREKIWDFSQKERDRGSANLN